MGLCRCPKRKVTTQFCYEHRVNVCESCLVEDHPNCIVQGYLQWLKDSDYEPVCTICRRELIQEECIRLLCYHVLHWRCLDEQLSQLPSTTAPAGYTCPTCGHEVIPRDNVMSPVADVIRTKLQRARWANAMGLAGGGPRRSSSTRHHDPTHSQLLQDSRGLDSSWSSPSPVPNGASQSALYMSTHADSSQHSTLNMVADNVTSSRGNVAMSSKQGGSGMMYGDNDSIASSSGRPYSVSSQQQEPLLRRNEDEDKYKKKSPMELMHRWFQSKFLLGGRRRGDPTKRWTAICVLIAIGLLLIVYFMSRVGRLSAESEPMLMHEFNPDIRNGVD